MPKQTTILKTAMIEEYFDTLPRQEQRELLTRLGSKIKEQPAHLFTPCSENEFVRVFTYTSKYNIPYTYKKIRNKIRFTFSNLTVRNQVLVGMRTL